MYMRDRDMRGMDGRNPYGSRGGYVVSSRGRRRGRRGDRGMPMHEDMRGDMNYTGGRGGYPMRGGDYAQNQNSNMDMRGDYRSNNMGDMARRGDYGYDGHYGMHGGRQGGYEPVEFMGYCSGYYGSPEQDYARGGRRDYGYDMRYGRDYGYDYGYDDYGDFGEVLSDEELKEWEHKLLSKLSDQEKQVFSKDAIMQKIKQMGIKMDDFSEKELYVNTLANYTDHKKSIGMNPDLAIKLAYDDFCDDDSKYEGAEWLSVYFDTFVDLDK